MASSLFPTSKKAQFTLLFRNVLKGDGGCILRVRELDLYSHYEHSFFRCPRITMYTHLQPTCRNYVGLTETDLCRCVCMCVQVHAEARPEDNLVCCTLGAIYLSPYPEDRVSHWPAVQEWSCLLPGVTSICYHARLLFLMKVLEI